MKTTIMICKGSDKMKQFILYLIYIFKECKKIENKKHLEKYVE
jgi:hypothetical protein